MAINLNGNAESTYSSDISAADGTFSGNVDIGGGNIAAECLMGVPKLTGKVCFRDWADKYAVSSLRSERATKRC